MPEIMTMLSWPGSRPGKWAVHAILGFFASMIVFYGLVASGQHGGETFFSNPLLSISLLVAATCGIVSALLSFWALVFAKDRKLVLVMCLLVGSFVLYFTAGEIIGHS